MTYEREDATGGERLHKLMARCGIASKRKCEELIKQGRITIDGRLVQEMGVKVDLAKQDVRYDGERLKPEPYVHFIGYKPRNTLSTSEDGFGRKTVLDMVRDPKGRRLFQVGRLDQNAEGLVLLTNDGGFAQDVAHPRRKLDRTFFLKVRGVVTPESAASAREGLWLSDGRTSPMEVQIVRIGREITTLKCRVVESQHRQLSRVWAKLGHPVQRMVLVRLGPIGTMGLSKGAVRKLTREEIELLRSGAPAEIRLPASRRFGRTPEEAGDAVAWGGAMTDDDGDVFSSDPDEAPAPAPRRVVRPGRPAGAGAGARPPRSGGFGGSSRPAGTGGFSRPGRPSGAVGGRSEGRTGGGRSSGRTGGRSDGPTGGRSGGRGGKPGRSGGGGGRARGR